MNWDPVLISVSVSVSVAVLYLYLYVYLHLFLFLCIVWFNLIARVLNLLVCLSKYFRISFLVLLVCF